MSNEKTYTASCLLCPQHCQLRPGQSGRCHARENREGEIISRTYGEVAAWNVDPIEKKPLYHFYPGSWIFSVGGFGCNLSCSFCQNYEVSQQHQAGRKVTPAELAELSVREQRSIGLCFTYSEPSVWFEMIRDTAPFVKAQGGKVVLVSNGTISPHFLEELIPWLDAANIDIKAFSEDFYQHYCGSKLAWVLDNVERLAGRVHLEVTTLLIQGANDHPRELRELAQWLAKLNVPLAWHLSAYHPAYRLKVPATDRETLDRAWDIAKEYLPYVYLGNVRGGSTTFCPRCGETVIKREPFLVNRLDGGCCPKCGKGIFGVGMI
ncbi:pyruvate-formate lyase-activating enzyme [Desulfosporosinus orientis DSM 765]|uniref:Pyruvate-formate lyase-activating enzyme n=1 Tax=Desulfosporosinus orientis (strain ATCC 19365 / DSM 765 / NCIMB 8382 / VKM B-1628 / Singapore I) TaxID=768706 RepID=G7W7V3_DESOD|nr:AmmeMemoRadiSam system radical SAM enzyme [Desulfosporosinus orientis]AET66168.1 pyruvate-formate lyase-activating enzyme [Desulfosporosinus orientis DSM 765]